MSNARAARRTFKPEFMMNICAVEDSHASSSTDRERPCTPTGQPIVRPIPWAPARPRLFDRHQHVHANGAVNGTVNEQVAETEPDFAVRAITF